MLLAEKVAVVTGVGAGSGQGGGARAGPRRCRGGPGRPDREPARRGGRGDRAARRQGAGRSPAAWPSPRTAPGSPRPWPTSSAASTSWSTARSGATSPSRSRPPTSAFWRKVYEVNLWGPLQLVQACFPAMKARGGGSVVNIASMSARLIRPNDGGYSTSKGALLTATKSMAIDLAPHKIRVNAVVPGWIWGPNVQTYVDWQVGERGCTPEDVIAEITAGHPARRDPAAGGHRRGDRVLRVGDVAHDHRPVARRERRGVLRMTDPPASSPARSRW